MNEKEIRRLVRDLVFNILNEIIDDLPTKKRERAKPAKAAPHPGSVSLYPDPKVDPKVQEELYDEVLRYHRDQTAAGKTLSFDDAHRHVAKYFRPSRVSSIENEQREIADRISALEGRHTGEARAAKIRNYALSHGISWDEAQAKVGF